MKPQPPKNSFQKKALLYFVGAITLVSAVVFTRTLVRAAIYDPGTTGLEMIYSSDSSSIPSSYASTSLTSSSTTHGSGSATVTKVIPPDYPARLLIPSLDINAAVQELGINTKDNIGVPTNFTDVGWYSYGTPPGESGTAVIDGHVDNGLSLAGVFKHLSDIQPGAEVDVITHGNTPLHFVVTSVQVYDYENLPSQAIFGIETDPNTGSEESLLRLITCDGTWVNGGDTYNERLIVTAELVN